MYWNSHCNSKRSWCPHSAEAINNSIINTQWLDSLSTQRNSEGCHSKWDNLAPSGQLLGALHRSLESCGLSPHKKKKKWRSNCPDVLSTVSGAIVGWASRCTSAFTWSSSFLYYVIVPTHIAAVIYTLTASHKHLCPMLILLWASPVRSGAYFCMHGLSDRVDVWVIGGGIDPKSICTLS